MISQRLSVFTKLVTNITYKTTSLNVFAFNMISHMMLMPGCVVATHASPHSFISSFHHTVNLLFQVLQIQILNHKKIVCLFEMLPRHMVIVGRLSVDTNNK